MRMPDFLATGISVFHAIFMKIIEKSLGYGSVGRSSVGAFGCLALVIAASSALSVQARELSLGGVNDAVEQQVEENVEEAVEESVQDRIDETVSEVVEDIIVERTLSLGGVSESYLEKAIEEKVEEAVEEAVTEDVESSIEESVEDGIAENITQDIEEDIEETIAREVEESVTDSVEEAVEESVAEAVEESVSETVAGAVEQSVAENVEDSVEESVADNVEGALESGVEEQLAVSLEQGVEAGLESGLEETVADAAEEKLESEIDEILERIESDFEVDEGRIQKGQWLVMAEPEVFEQLAKEGYLFDTVTELPGMGLRLAEVAAPSSFDISAVRQGVVDVVGSDRAEVDLNHIYTAGNPDSSAESDQGVQPRVAMPLPADADQLPLRIGMIDSQVDVTHPALRSAHISSKSFAPAGSVLPEFHGTAVASIIAASDTDFRGLAPNAELYAAAVFEQDAVRGEIASTVSLVRALDWLISSGVDVVNISLAGPPNRLLETALKRAAEHDVMILAAAGNGGPVAQPMYPAAYDSVVAVTAVDAAGQVFRLANRGKYLDLSAPGVGMLHARAGGGYTASSGTSFAVPFAATAAARLRQLQPGQDVLKLLIESAKDLGPPGRDDIYGYGLVRPANS